MECSYTTGLTKLEGNPFLSMPEWSIEVAYVGEVTAKFKSRGPRQCTEQDT